MRTALCLILAACFGFHSQPVPLPVGPEGRIAYIRGGTEIRLIQPDGNGDRLLWTHPDATEELGLYDVAWRPDGKELVFSSAHASAVSLYHADLYGIQPDGSGFRKLTNPPAYDAFARYPKGSVTVTLRNNQYSFQQAMASSGVFTVYVAGADRPQQITLPPGSAKTIVFPSVADFGKNVQAVVAIWGNFRWFIPGTDVQAGKNVKAPEFGISGDGIELLGAFRPVWRSDGSEVSYRTGVCTVNRIPKDPPEGAFFFKPMFGGKHPFGACFWDWGPGPATSDQIIYTENSGEESSIWLMKEGGTHPGKKLTAYSNIQYQLLRDLHWLPDGMGILYSNARLMEDAANIFHYELKSGRTRQVTDLEGQFTGAFAVSPDGKWIVYEKANAFREEKEIDLWIIGIDGTGDRLLVKQALNPSWGR